MRLVVVSLVGLVEVVGLCGVGPPCIEAHVVEVAQIAPVDVARLGVEGVVGLHAFLSWPGVEGQQPANLLQLAVWLCPGSEAGPDADHQVCVVAVDIVHHLLRALKPRLAAGGCVLCCQLAQVVGQVLCPGGIRHLINIIWVLKSHGVPVAVAAPVLPVLHDAVEGYAQLAVAIQHCGQLVAGLVALAALPVAHGPQRKHCGLACELAYAIDDAVLTAVAIHHIVVYA